MNCTNPITIINNTSHYLQGMDAFWREVPCGKCEACVNSKKNEWVVRSYAEFVANEERGGITCFVTLTYRNKDLPIFRKYGIDSLRCCFDKQHIDTFIKNLFKLLKKAFGHSKGLRYLCCCEYGKHTKRSHYHLLLFLPHYEFPIDDAYLKKLIQQAWSHGFVLFSKETKGGLRVKSDLGIKYCAKYCTKDVNYYGLKDVQFLIDEMNKLKDYPQNSPEREKLRKFKRLLPRHYQSEYYGFQVLKRLFVDELDDDGNFILAKDWQKNLRVGYQIPLTSQVYQVPRYVLNRLSYDNDKEGNRYMSKLGRVLLKECAFIKYEKQSIDYNHMFTYAGLNSVVNNNSKVIHELFGAPTGRHEFDSISNLQNFVYKLMDGRSWYLLSLYKYVLKDVDASNVEFLDEDEVYRLAQKVFDTRYEMDDHYRDLPRPLHYLTRERVKEESYNLFNTKEIFRDFDTVLAIYDKLQRYASLNHSKAIYKKESRVQNLRDKLIKLNLYNHV